MFVLRREYEKVVAELDAAREEIVEVGLTVLLDRKLHDLWENRPAALKW